jgi:acyl carrier protein
MVRMSKNLLQQEVETHIEELVRLHIDSNEPIPLEADLLNDLAIDSIEMVDLGIKIEKHFVMKLPMSDLRRCCTVEEIIQLVQQIKAENP